MEALAMTPEELAADPCVPHPSWPLPLVVVAIDGPVADDIPGRIAAAPPHRIRLGVWRGGSPQPELLDAMDVTVTSPTSTPLPRSVVTVGDVAAAVAAITARVLDHRQAAVVGITLLRVIDASPVEIAVAAESLAYSLLLGGRDFAAWRASRPVRPIPTYERPPVRVARDGDTVEIALDRPERRNSFTAGMRDALCEALQLPALDPSVERIVLRGEGPAFSSGGDLDEFGTATDLVAAHEIRMAHNVGLAVHRVADRVTARLHGPCIGAGIEVPAFAGHVMARPDTFFRLPEVGMGLIPGAGGTVSLPRRIGRWRTAWLMLSGEDLDARAALEWGLVDEVTPG